MIRVKRRTSRPTIGPIVITERMNTRSNPVGRIWRAKWEPAWTRVTAKWAPTNPTRYRSRRCKRSRPPGRESLGLPCGGNLLDAFPIRGEGRPPPEIPPEPRVRGRKGGAQDAGPVSAQDHPPEPPRHSARRASAASHCQFPPERGKRHRPFLANVPHPGVRGFSPRAERAAPRIPV